MALIVETGSGVADANSYGDLAGARAYASARGVELSATDSIVEAQLVLAMDYLEALDYIGRQVSYTQALSWPRKGIMFDPDTPFPSDEIPEDLISAEYQLVIEQFNGVKLQPSYNLSGGKGMVIERKVDVLDTRYSDRVIPTAQPIMPKVDALLRHLVLPTFMKTVRV